MREIKFRGLNGETGWHYGIPLTNKLGTYIIFEKVKQKKFFLLVFFLQILLPESA